VNDVSEYREQYPSLKQRFEDTAADKTADRFDLPDNHGSADAACLSAGRDVSCNPQISEDVPAQIACCIFSDPTPIHIEGELCSPLHENGAGICGAKGQDKRKRPLLDEVVDPSALYLQWYDFEQKGADCQNEQRNLMSPTYGENIAENGGR